MIASNSRHPHATTMNSHQETNASTSEFHTLVDTACSIIEAPHQQNVSSMPGKDLIQPEKSYINILKHIFPVPADINLSNVIPYPNFPGPSGSGAMSLEPRASSSRSPGKSVIVRAVSHFNYLRNVDNKHIYIF